MALLGGAGVLAAGGLDRQTSLRSRLMLDRDAADSVGGEPRAPQTKPGLKLKVRGGRHLASASASAEDLQERMQENEDTESFLHEKEAERPPPPTATATLPVPAPAVPLPQPATVPAQTLAPATTQTLVATVPSQCAAAGYQKIPTTLSEMEAFIRDLQTKHALVDPNTRHVIHHIVHDTQQNVIHQHFGIKNLCSQLCRGSPRLVFTETLLRSLRGGRCSAFASPPAGTSSMGVDSCPGGVRTTREAIRTFLTRAGARARGSGSGWLLSGSPRPWVIPIKF